EYLVFFEPLQTKLVGLTSNHIEKLRRPDEKLNNIIKHGPSDPLIHLLIDVLELIQDHSQLRTYNFGIFGSILHDFYNIDYSDLDFIIYGRKNLSELREILSDFYSDRNFPLNNEFDGPISEIAPKHWNFQNYSVKEYIEYQRSKLIYAVIKSKKMGRIVKIEFEPVKNWNEITNQYYPKTRIKNVGWIKAVGRILDDKDGYYIGGSYPIEIDRIISGPKVDEITQIINYIEEFRGQLNSDDQFIVEGNLEKVSTPKNEYYQITLTYGPNYDYQVLKMSIIKSL
ncbi:MAG: hypothetical protein ACTSPQ_17765, partial [Candidatus Helarchaeota archaeon]